MLLIDAAAKVVFDWRRRNFLLLVFAAMLVKTGIWHIPNINDAIVYSRNPFVVPFDDPLKQYLLTNWLSPFLAWVIGATSDAGFALLHLVFAIGFTTLFTWLCFQRFAEREARIAMVIFASLPASATAYFWVGMDGLTLLLMLAVVASDRRPWIAGLFGVALGLQHFEQGFVGLSVLLFAVMVAIRLGHDDVYSWRAAAAAWLGVVIGKIALVLIFWRAGMVVAPGRLVHRQLADDAGTVLVPHTGRVLGGAWPRLVRRGPLCRPGSRQHPLLSRPVRVMPLLMFVGDQTRVLAIVTFPLLFAFWLNQRSFLEEITRLQRAACSCLDGDPVDRGLGGLPKWSALPYGIAYAIGKLTTWYELPTVDIGDWPFR